MSGQFDIFSHLMKNKSLSNTTLNISSFSTWPPSTNVPLFFRDWQTGFRWADLSSLDVHSQLLGGWMWLMSLGYYNLSPFSQKHRPKQQDDHNWLLIPWERSAHTSHSMDRKVQCSLSLSNKTAESIARHSHDKYMEKRGRKTLRKILLWPLPVTEGKH